MKAVLEKFFILFIVASLNYISVLLFTNAYYKIYFLLIFLVGYYLYRIALNKNFIYILISTVLTSSFLFEYLDENVYNVYLYYDLEKYYSYFGGEVVYILICMHSIFLVTTLLKKNRLQLQK